MTSETENHPIPGGAVLAAATAFRNLADQCEHRRGSDCGEPTQDFDHLSCSPANCPVLLRAVLHVEG